jgi:hypothetical protein
LLLAKNTFKVTNPIHLLSKITSKSKVERYAEGVRRFDFDAGLAPYDYGGWAAWKALTGLVTEADLARLLPVRCGRWSVCLRFTRSRD